MEPGGADTCLNLLYRYVPPLLKGVAWGAIWLILSPDLVLAVLGQKRGEGEGEEETFPPLPSPPPSPCASVSRTNKNSRNAKTRFEFDSPVFVSRSNESCSIFPIAFHPANLTL